MRTITGMRTIHVASMVVAAAWIVIPLHAQAPAVAVMPPVAESGHFATHVARAYDRPADEVGTAVAATLEALGFTATSDRGVFVTRSLRIRGEALARALGSAATGSAWMHLVVSVPAGFAPARVHVTAIGDFNAVRALSPSGELRSSVADDLYGGRRGFHVPEVGQWFFDALESRLGTSGAPLAADHRARAKATTAMPGGPDCLATIAELGTVPSPAGEAPGWTMPGVVHEEEPVLLHVPIAARVDTRVTLAAIVGEDGVAYSIRPAPGENEGVLEVLLVASVGTAAAWRFTPATIVGCPVPAAVHVTITHRLEY